MTGTSRRKALQVRSFDVNMVLCMLALILRHIEFLDKVRAIGARERLSRFVEP